MVKKKLDSETVPQVAPHDVHDSAPAIGWYSDHVLFHRIWNRPGLARRDRSIVTVSALVACGHYAQLTGHLNRALNHGVTPDEIVELMTHLAFQAGWPNVMSSLKVMREVFGARSMIPGSQPTGSAIALACLDPANPLIAADDGAAGQFTRALEAGLGNLVENDVRLRPGLASRDRSLADITVLIATGQLEPLPAAARRGLADGLRREQLAELVTHLGFYVGLPAARLAAASLDAAAD